MCAIKRNIIKFRKIIERETIKLLFLNPTFGLKFHSYLIKTRHLWENSMIWFSFLTILLSVSLDYLPENLTQFWFHMAVHLIELSHNREEIRHSKKRLCTPKIVRYQNYDFEKKDWIWEGKEWRNAMNFIPYVVRSSFQLTSKIKKST